MLRYTLVLLSLGKNSSDNWSGKILEALTKYWKVLSSKYFLARLMSTDIQTGTNTSRRSVSGQLYVWCLRGAEVKCYE